MFPDQFEKAFSLNLEAVQLLQTALGSSFLDAYIENVENQLDGFTVRVLEGVPNAETVAKIDALYTELREIPLAGEDLRKLSQLLLLKGSKTEQLQANHQLTPDGLGFLFVYLLEQFYPDKKHALTMFDPAVGMGNLLLTALLNLQSAGYKVKGVGVDIDDTLLAVAAANVEWTKGDMQLFHQDSLQDLLLDPTDVAIADLPIGYYPNDQKAQDFITGAKEGHSYAHHLLMEQAMNYVKEAGYGLFLVPSNLLESEQSVYFKKWMAEKVFLQGLIQLPDRLFQSEQSRKSILIVQNHGESAIQKEVFLAKLASLTDEKVIAKFFKQFEDWKSAN
ncbi:class I SAM-dependent methyltransferase [Enterococcus dispar]|jgi:site-specific DNA-methyltransferase (adenine-specific)|uniref:class I SAM-dependent methyltransferase n=1 Tax=Enterococcus dispar TaxID=44009 RepID=UPI00189CAF2B|nr:class I SAM-dependent methyltransferase [Enterococcus dispar]WCG34255.1 class I SAM-dependent methyltransferase [Enterococcus dispar]